ncbi:MAG TPA: heparan-alpha-glucosaminide N-acetyltransferase domain-containing protein [Methylomirabilota bacterium]|nr:heparan-alpha-glucosaminide N-acetyltransferase domain-containing protein [Methylomirabilota bacterium]
MQQSRLISLDAFRGLTVAGMVLVNNPGTWRAVYAPLRHADWHGSTPTDLIFPFFLFIVGVAIPLALGRRLTEGQDRGRLVARVLRRSTVIFALGLILNAIPGFELTTIRIPGVLQRIAVCYLAAALLFMATGWRAQAMFSAAALLGYWAALTWVPVTGFGAGDLSKEGNLAAWLDRAVLGPHIWRIGRVYDPEGILSTVPAVVTTVLGVLTGHWIRGRRPPAVTARGLLWAGAVGLGVGLAWSRWLPLNKSLWTSSYVVFTAGAALVALATCYWMIEIRGRRWWTPPFVVLGVNALVVFFLSTLLAKLLVSVHVAGPDGQSQILQSALFDRVFASWASPANASLAWALANVLLWLAVMWPLYRGGVRLTV